MKNVGTALKGLFTIGLLTSAIGNANASDSKEENKVTADGDESTLVTEENFVPPIEFNLSPENGEAKLQLNKDSTLRELSRGIKSDNDTSDNDEDTSVPTPET